MKRLTSGLLAIAVVMTMPGLVSAITVIDGGTTDFAYAEFPSGPYHGVFHADGKLLTGVDINGGTTSMTYEFAGEYGIMVLTAALDSNATIDGAALLIRSPVPIVPGDFSVDPAGLTVAFIHVDDASAFALPSDPTVTDWVAWFYGITAAKKFVAASGSILLTHVTPDRISGTFSGLTVEFSDGTPVALTDGAFDVHGATVAVEHSTWAKTKASYRD